MDRNRNIPFEAYLSPNIRSETLDQLLLGIYFARELLLQKHPSLGLLYGNDYYTDTVRDLLIALASNPRSEGRYTLWRHQGTLLFDIWTQQQPLTKITTLIGDIIELMRTSSNDFQLALDSVLYGINMGLLERGLYYDTLTHDILPTRETEFNPDDLYILAGVA